MRFTKCTFLKNAIDDKERDEFTRENSNRGVTATNDLLRIEGDDGTAISYVVFNGSQTPYDCVRDCGDHWIHAGWDRYYKIDKATMEITDNDAEDR